MINELGLISSAILKAESLFSSTFLNDVRYETIGRSEAEVVRINKVTPVLIKKYKSAQRDLESTRTSDKLHISKDTFEFYQLISSLPKDNNEPFVKRTTKKLMSNDISLFTSTYHEIVTRKRYQVHNIAISHIEEGERKTPDFVVEGETSFFVECKALLAKEQLETPSIASLSKRIQNTLRKNKINGFLEILISSKDVQRLTHLILGELEKVLPQPDKGFITTSDFEFKFTPIHLDSFSKNPNITIEMNDFDIIHFEMHQNDQILEWIAAVKITPLRSPDYTSALKNQIKKSKNQFNSDSTNVLHVLFPYIKLKDFLEFIEMHSGAIFKSIERSSITALLVEFPYLLLTDEKGSDLYPPLVLPFINSQGNPDIISNTNIFWTENIKVVDSQDALEAIFLEFDVCELRRTFFSTLITKDLRYQLRIYLIQNTLIAQFQAPRTLFSTRFDLPNEVIPSRVKLAFNIDSEQIAINGEIYEGKRTTYSKNS